MPASGLLDTNPTKRLLFNYMVNYSKELDKTFASLADPTRRLMVAKLSEGARTVGDLSRPLRRQMSAPAISKHLRVLEVSGLIRRKRSGRHVICFLLPRAFRGTSDWIKFHERFWNMNLDNLGRYITRESKRRKK